ncbi:uncharacterized protein KZ484_021088 [Pholidichthys leucotaenia]
MVLRNTSVQPAIGLYSQQQNDFNQEEDVNDPQLLNQEINVILVQVEPVCSQIKEEQGELCIGQEGEQETETFNEDSPQQNDFNQEEDVNDPQLLNQEINVILVQVEPVCSQIKEEQGELCISQEGEQFGLKQETETFNEGLPQQHECKHEEVLADHQLWNQVWNQERNNSLDQEEPEPRHVKEEREGSTNQEGVLLVQKQEADNFMVTSIYEENDPTEAETNGAPQQHGLSEEEVLMVQERNSSLNQEELYLAGIKSEEEEPCSSEEEEYFGLKQETDTLLVTPTNNDSNNSAMSEKQFDTETGEKSVKCNVIEKVSENMSKRRKCKFSKVDETACNTCGKRCSAPQQHGLSEEEVLMVQERNSDLNQEEPNPAGIKSEEEESCSSQEEEYFGLKQETDTFLLTPTNDSNNSPMSDNEFDTETDVSKQWSENFVGSKLGMQMIN